MQFVLSMTTNEQSKIRSFTDLTAWQVSHRLVVEVYKITQKFPKSEIFGLVSQMRRCAVSIVSNIAEGFGCDSNKEKIRFYEIARGSITELQSQLSIARDIGYITKEDFESIARQAIAAHTLVNGLKRHLQNTNH